MSDFVKAVPTVAEALKVVKGTSPELDETEQNKIAEAVGLGVLNLYSADTRDYVYDDLDLARLIGAHASIALAHVRGEENLRRAIDSRCRSWGRRSSGSVLRAQASR